MWDTLYYISYQTHSRTHAHGFTIVERAPARGGHWQCIRTNCVYAQHNGIKYSTCYVPARARAVGLCGPMSNERRNVRIGATSEIKSVKLLAGVAGLTDHHHHHHHEH